MDLLADGSATRDMMEAWDAAPKYREQHIHHVRRAFGDGTHIGDFVAKYLRQGDAVHVLDRAKRPDGTTAWDPKEYMGIIQSKVAAPMSKLETLPPAFDGRPDMPDLQGRGQYLPPFLVRRRL